VAAKLTVEQVLRLRMRSQRLIGPRPGSVPEVVRDVGALQAQSTRAARLAVRPRGRDLDGPAVNHACNVDRSVVRTWVMRGTLHMIPAADIEWMLALYKPPADALSARERELGLDVPLLARARSAIPEVLGAGQPFSRSELIRALASHGVQVGPDGQAPAHLIAHAAAHGLICRGPDRSDDEPTYVLLSEWVGDRAQPPGGEAIAELARRYLGGYGPVGPEDFAYWSGLPVRAARRAFDLIGDELTEVDAAGQRAWLRLPPGEDARLSEILVAAGEPAVRLLGQFDAYLLGYRDRGLALRSEFARRIQAGGGMLNPAVMVDGRIVGRWRQRRGARGAAVLVEPFEDLDEPVLAGLEAEVADLGRFLGITTTVLDVAS
jgi:hypothetical protein